MGKMDEAEQLGREIVSFMRQRLGRFLRRKTTSTFTLLATPAEGLSGRFVAMDRERFGTIRNVTDREYYTNSFHLPVSHPATISRKLAVEGPYHGLTNAGHISYVGAFVPAY